MNTLARTLLVSTAAATLAVQATAQTRPAVSVRAGVGVSNRYGNTSRAAGPDLGVSLVFRDRQPVAIEAHADALFFSGISAESSCTLGAGGCLTHVSAPGPVLGIGVNAVVRAGERVGIFAGLGFSASGSFPAGPVAEHRNAFSATGGLRLKPFSGAVRALGFELHATRYFRTIGEVRTVVAPSLSWTF